MNDLEKSGNMIAEIAIVGIVIVYLPSDVSVI